VGFVALLPLFRFSLLNTARAKSPRLAQPSPSVVVATAIVAGHCHPRALHSCPLRATRTEALVWFECRQAPLQPPADAVATIVTAKDAVAARPRLLFARSLTGSRVWGVRVWGCQAVRDKEEESRDRGGIGDEAAVGVGDKQGVGVFWVVKARVQIPPLRLVLFYFFISFAINIVNILFETKISQNTIAISIVVYQDNNLVKYINLKSFVSEFNF